MMMTEVEREGPKGALLAILLAHGTLVAFLAIRNAPNVDETAHLAAGLSHWSLGSFDLYRVNPPLIRMIATLPLLGSMPNTDWKVLSETAQHYDRPEFLAGHRLVTANGYTSFWYFTLARWALLPVSLMGGAVCYFWAKELYGWRSGLMSCAMWSFCPNLLSWGASINPDVGATAFGVLSNWLFWRWLRRPSWGTSIVAGIGLGAVELTKSSWVVLFGLWPCLWMLWRLLPASKLDGKTMCRNQPRGIQLILILFLGIYLLNLGYGFEQTGVALGDYQFISQAFGGRYAHVSPMNRFGETWLGWLPVPVPRNYLRGIDVQLFDFEKGKWSYLRGEQRLGGWWFYYVYAMLVKTPLGFIGLGFVAMALMIIHPREFSSRAATEFVLAAPVVIILCLLSSQTGFNRYLRYALPVYPFLYISCSRVAILFLCENRILKCIVTLLFAGGVISSLWVYPHSQSYFNSVVGGPNGGHRHLLDANIDWGQDVLLLTEWANQHPEARPLFAELSTSIDFKTLGLDADYVSSLMSSNLNSSSPQFPAGWYAIGINDLMGYRRYGQVNTLSQSFRSETPIARIGYSIYIYRVH